MKNQRQNKSTGGNTGFPSNARPETVMNKLKNTKNQFHFPFSIFSTTFAIPQFKRCGGGETGRRATLRSLCSKGLGSSNLLFRTREKLLDIQAAFSFLVCKVCRSFAKFISTSSMNLFVNLIFYRRRSKQIVRK